MTWPLLILDAVWAVFLYASGELDSTNLEIANELIAFFVVTPLVVRWVVGTPQHGYRFRIVHPGDPHKPSYQESFKIMWLLNWRLLAAMLIALVPLSYLLGKITNRPLTETLEPIVKSPFWNKVGLTAVDLAGSLALMPFLIPGMIGKRYQGFRVEVERP